MMKFDAEEETRFVHINDSRCRYSNEEDFFKRPNPHLYKWLVEVWHKPHWTLTYRLFWYQYNMAKWMIDSGCPMTEETMTEAVYEDNLEALKWLKEHGCPWNKEALIKEANLYRDEETKEWIRKLPD